MARKRNIDNKERRLWIDNDEGLYRWWKSSRLPIGKFIAANKSEIDAAIRRALAPAPQKTWRDYNSRRRNGAKTDAALGAGAGSLLGGAVGGLVAGPPGAYGGFIAGGALGAGLVRKPSKGTRVGAAVGGAILGPIGAGIGAAVATDSRGSGGSSRKSNMSRLANRLKRYP